MTPRFLPILMALAVAVAVGGVLLALDSRSQQNSNNIGSLAQAVSRIERLERSDKEQRAQRRRAYQLADLSICRQIEKLKKAQREQAISSFKKLDETLTLLNIRKTPAIVARATSDRDERLRLFKPLKCSELPSQKGEAG